MTDEYRAYRDAEVAASGLSLKDWYGQRYLYSDHWRHLKSKKFGEVGRRCEKCKATKRIQVHHLNYRSIYDVETSDLQVLCSKCHREAHVVVVKPAKKQKDRRKKGKNPKRTKQAKAILKSWSIPLDDRIKAVLDLYEGGAPPMKLRRMMRHFQNRAAKVLAEGIKARLDAQIAAAVA